MAIRNIRKNGDDILRIKCKRIPEVTESIRRVIKDMFETMYAANGVGLAAPQIGIVKRMITVDDYDGHSYAMINPVIIKSEGEQLSTEGCLSIPGYRGNVKRPLKVTVEAINEEGKHFTVEAEGMLAVIMCHEIDHLDGILYKDKAEKFEIIPPEEDK